MLSMLFRSFWYDRGINTAVMFGVLCAAAVLTGALLVGDSMRGSLKALTLDRLGNIDTILFASQFIEEHTDKGGSREDVILLSAAVEFNGKISGIQLLGQGTTCIANQALADKIGLQTDETVSLRFMPPQSIPPESSLGRKDQLLRTRINVDEIVPNQGMGRFSLKMDTQAEPLLIVPLHWLQQRLDVPGKVNAILFHSDSPEKVFTPQEREQLLKKSFQPTLADLGIIAEEHGNSVYITSARMLFTDKQVDEISLHLCGQKKITAKAQSTQRILNSEILHKGLLYLATSIRSVENNTETPYSTIYAIQCEELKLAENEIALNRWTADDLGVEVGSEIELTWFDPDNVAETKTGKFTLAKILPMTGLGADPHVVPTVQGFTDEVSIADWNPPFPFDAKKIRMKDEEYWDKYKAAPKAFVSLAAGQKLFGSRFGKVTTLVLPRLLPQKERGLEDASALAGENFPMEHFGINILPIKEQGLAASSGTTPFSVLFLAFSFFIIASALMLVMMLFRLSVEMKAKRIGIQLAIGWSSGLITKTLLAEGVLIAVIGSFLGTFLGIGYAAVMIYGLTTWWVDAVTVPFLTLFINPFSLMIGFASGTVLAMLTILWSIRSVTKIPVRRLLYGETDLPFSPKSGAKAK